MTEEKEKGSRLKGALGLDNLKGLAEILKQFSETMQEVKELKEIIGDVAKENSPISRALAQRIEAEGLNTLREGDSAASEEVRKDMNEKLETQTTRVEQLEGENKGLKEDRVISEVTEKINEALDKRLPSGGGNGSGQSKLTQAIENLVAERLEKLLIGGDGTMTAEQMLNVIREEVGKVAGGKKPEDMVEDLVSALTVGDKLREKLGIAGTGIGGRLLQEGGGDSGLKTDLVKALLEDEREKLKITLEHDTQVERNKHIGTLADTVKENLPDGIQAIIQAAEASRDSTSRKPEEKQQVFLCGTCGVQFSPPPGWEGQSLECPKSNGGCGRIYTKEELLA